MEMTYAMDEQRVIHKGGRTGSSAAEEITFF
jgi:hypothetical protein